MDWLSVVVFVVVFVSILQRPTASDGRKTTEGAGRIRSNYFPFVVSAGGGGIVDAIVHGARGNTDGGTDQNHGTGGGKKERKTSLPGDTRSRG